ncbi:hypothetical protein HDU93_004482 [Gonapodya sp. JEL0774]|nr:hypothetical protein HDU93_004482 [Gonapodya sp. JEL0774]
MAVISALSLLDRFLALWIFLAMLAGILLGNYSESARNVFGGVQIADVSVTIAVGLLAMMWPVLCRVRYEMLPEIFRRRDMLRNIGVSLLINWIVAPLLMTGLAWATLPDLPDYRNGIILVGVARCIAMVLIWNQLAGGDAEYCAILVAINSVLQMLLFSPVAYFLVVIVGHSDSSVNVGLWLVTRSVLIFLGIPLAGGMLTRLILRFVVPTMLGRREAGAKWYDGALMKWLGPLSLLGLLYTILVMFTIQGQRIIHEIASVVRVAVPLILYFSLVFSSTFYLSYRLGLPYQQCATQAFTAAGNNFELAIAVSVATFGVSSEEAVAATVGPLIEVPVLVGLVYVSLGIGKRMEREVGQHVESADGHGGIGSQQMLLKNGGLAGGESSDLAAPPLPKPLQ